MNILYQIEQLKNRLAELEAEATKHEVKQWGPKNGGHIIASNGEVCSEICGEEWRLFGTMRSTKELAERAAGEMRTFNRLLAYRDEFCPDYVPDWTNHAESKCVISYDLREHKYIVIPDMYRKRTGTVYFPKEIAEELAAKLNSGEVELY